MTPGRDRRLALALAITVSVAAGCHAARPTPRMPATLPSAARLLGDITTRRQALTSLRGIARISYESDEQRVGSRQAVVVAPPDRFRLEVLSPFGTLAVAACDGRELALWVRREQRTYRGPATAASVAAYAGVRVSVHDVVSVLLGLPPERQVTAPPTVALDPAGLVHVHAPIEDGHEDLWFAPDSLLPVASETTLENGTQTLRVEFGDYRTIAGTAVPLRIDMRLYPAGRRVRVRYDEPATGVAVGEELFVFPVRAGVAELRLDAYAGGAAS